MPRAVEVDCFDQLPLYREKGGSREVSVQRLAVSLVKTTIPKTKILWEVRKSVFNSIDSRWVTCVKRTSPCREGAFPPSRQS